MAEVQAGAQPPWWRRHLLALTGVGLILLLAYAVLAATVLPGWIVSLSGSKADENHRLDAIVNTRNALLGVLAPLVVAIGAIAALLNYRETSAQNRRTLDVTRRGQLTERFTKAIDQLGQTDENKLDIRLGGIYALEQVAKESKELHRPVMEILTAFLREHSRKPREASAELAEGEVAASTQSDAASNKQAMPLRADFQAIATVLGRREVSHDPDGFSLDLRGVALGMVDFRRAQLQAALFEVAQLRGAYFRDAQLQKANFAGAQLHEAYFVDARLQGAYLGHAQLQTANFYRAQLQGARFFGAGLRGADLGLAQLQEADFAGAQLQDTNFRGAQLQDTNFRGAQLQGANFSGAFGLTPEQFDSDLNVDKMRLPKNLADALQRKQNGPSE